MSSSIEVQNVMQSLSTKGFLAKIYAYRNDIRQPLRFSRPNEDGALSQPNWLQAGGDSESPLVWIDVLSKTSTRIWVKISGRTHNGNMDRLGRSNNGFLGLYGIHSVTQPWKLEPLDWNGREMVCHLRDHNGYRVGFSDKSTQVGGHKLFYLDAVNGEPCKFLISKVAIPGKEGVSWVD